MARGLVTFGTHLRLVRLPPAEFPLGTTLRKYHSLPTTRMLYADEFKARSICALVHRNRLTWQRLGMGM